MVKKIGTGLLVVLVIIQFIRPEKNESTSAGNGSIINAMQVPPEVHEVLKVSCYDCHSNNTVYPWYSNIQPVGWWLANHVNEGKKELNFDEFMTYEPKRAAKKLKEIVEVIEKQEMPLKSYTIIHQDAVMSAEQQKLVADWARGAQQNRIKTPDQAPAAETEEQEISEKEG